MSAPIFGVCPTSPQQCHTPVLAAPLCRIHRSNRRVFHPTTQTTALAYRQAMDGHWHLWQEKPGPTNFWFLPTPRFRQANVQRCSVLVIDGMAKPIFEGTEHACSNVGAGAVYPSPLNLNALGLFRR